MRNAALAFDLSRFWQSDNDTQQKILEEVERYVGHLEGQDVRLRGLEAILNGIDEGESPHRAEILEAFRDFRCAPAAEKL
jgi:hypothetical protein